MILELEAQESDEEEFERLFNEACEYMPDKLDAYYQKAVYLVQKRQYEEEITFVTDNLINKSGFLSQSFADDVYYLLANCYFELEEYKDAVVYYQVAINIDD